MLDKSDKLKNIQILPPTCFSLENVTLQNRFLVKRMLAKTAEGVVYKCVDLLDRSKPLIVKFRPYSDEHMQEIQAIQHIMDHDSLYYHKNATKSQCKTLPNVHAIGFVQRQSLITKTGESGTTGEPKTTSSETGLKSDIAVKSYMVMSKKGKTLEEYFFKQKNRLSLKSICTLGK